MIGALTSCCVSNPGNIHFSSSYECGFSTHRYNTGAVAFVWAVPDQRSGFSGENDQYGMDRCHLM
jgi:hypothetical protein